MRRAAAAFLIACVVASACAGDDAATPSAETATSASVAAPEPPESSVPEPSTTAAETATPAETPASAGEEPGELSPAEQVEALLAAEPASVEVQVDEAGAASAEIGPDGGSLTVTAPDGTSYELSIPPNALLTTETISATPITGASGAAVGDADVIGVQLEPEGLLFVAPVTLTMSGPGVPADAVGWTSRSDGSDFGLTLTSDVGGADTVTIQLTHFSNWGAGSPRLAALASDYGISDKARLAYSALEFAIRTPTSVTFNIALVAFVVWGTELMVALNLVNSAPQLERMSVELLGILVLAQGYPSGSLSAEAFGSMADSLAGLVDAWLLAIERELDRLMATCTESGPEAGLGALRWGSILDEMAAVAEPMALTTDFESTRMRVDQTAASCLVFRVVWEPEVTISDDEGSVTTSAIAESSPIPITGASPEGSGSFIGRSMGHPFEVVDIDASFPFPCEFALETGRATMGWILVPDWGAPGAENKPTVGRMGAIAADDEPLQIYCAGQDFGFNFFSAEMEILNSERLDAEGYFEFTLEIVREPEAFARTMTMDSSSIGSNTVLEQTVTVIAVPPSGE